MFLQIKCPICKNSNSVTERYPLVICFMCQKKYRCLTDDGSLIDFFVSSSGIFFSVVNYIVGFDNKCYINNVKCYATTSAYGIIIQSLDHNFSDLSI
jgi:hypothetical protein